MKHILISDDSFFLNGAKALLLESDIAFETINLNEKNARTLTRTLCRGDVVLIAVDNIYYRRELVNIASSISCRVVFAPAFHHIQPVEKELPWIVPRHVEPGYFIKLMRKLSDESMSQQSRLYDYFKVMDYFCESHKTFGHHYIKHTSIKRLSQKKRLILKKYNLDSSNSQGELLCRDVLLLKKKHQEKKHLKNLICGN